MKPNTTAPTPMVTSRSTSVPPRFDVLLHVGVLGLGLLRVLVEVEAQRVREVRERRALAVALLRADGWRAAHLARLADGFVAVCRARRALGHVDDFLVTTVVDVHLRCSSRFSCSCSSSRAADTPSLLTRNASTLRCLMNSRTASSSSARPSSLRNSLHSMSSMVASSSEQRSHALVIGRTLGDHAQVSLRALVESVRVLAGLECVLPHDGAQRPVAVAQVFGVGARGSRVALLADRLELSPQAVKRCDGVLVRYRAAEP